LDEKAEREKGGKQGRSMVDSSARSKTADDLEKLRQEAHEHLRATRWNEARTEFNHLLEYDREDEDALIGLALAMDRLGEYEKMYETAQFAVQVDPGSALALACKARALQKLERISEATIANDQALLLDTNLALAWFNRSGQQLLQEHFPEALRYAERALELDPTDARVWSNKALALLSLGRPYEALEAVNQSLAHDPNFLLSLQAKGEILRRYSRLEEVIGTMSHALDIAPDDISSLNLMAHALRTLGQFDRLLEITQKLVLLTPDSQFAWDSHMCALRGLGRFEEAGEAIDRVLEFDPTNVRYLMIKADNLYRQQLYRKAVSVAEDALQIDDEYPPARRIHEKAMRMMYQYKKKKK